jgi:hypothetical protein
VFIRDRGCGFDPAKVPDDRKGLAESVKARMARRGGSATIKSILGEGTEVALTMHRAPAEPSQDQASQPDEPVQDQPSRPEPGQQDQPIQDQPSRAEPSQAS